MLAVQISSRWRVAAAALSVAVVLLGLGFVRVEGLGSAANAAQLALLLVAVFSHS